MLVLLFSLLQNKTFLGTHTRQVYGFTDRLRGRTQYINSACVIREKQAEMWNMTLAFIERSWKRKKRQQIGKCLRVIVRL